MASPWTDPLPKSMAGAGGVYSRGTKVQANPSADLEAPILRTVSGETHLDNNSKRGVLCHLMFPLNPILYNKKTSSIFPPNRGRNGFSHLRLRSLDRLAMEDGGRKSEFLLRRQRLVFDNMGRHCLKQCVTTPRKP